MARVPGILVAGLALGLLGLAVLASRSPSGAGESPVVVAGEQSFAAEPAEPGPAADPARAVLDPFDPGMPADRGEGVVAAEPHAVRLLVRGRVVDRHGAALAGAMVHVDLEEPDGRIRHLTFQPAGSGGPTSATGLAVTGVDGRFTREVVRGRAWRLVVLVEHPDFAIGTAARTLGGGETELELGDLTLAHGATLRGRVVRRVDGRMLPAAGAEVRVVPVDAATSAARQRWREVLGGHVADAEGRFEIRHLPAGAWRVGVVHPATQRGGWELPQTVADGREHDLGTVELAAGQVVAGRVVDPEGRPVSDAEVRVSESTRLGAARTVQIREVAHTDADGRFEIRHLPEHPVALVVAAAGRRTWRRAHHVLTGESVEVVLAPGAEVRVFAVDAAGRAVEAAAVRVRPVTGADADELRPWRVPADLGEVVSMPADGLVFAGLDDGRYVVDAAVPGAGFGRSPVFTVAEGAVAGPAPIVRIESLVALEVLVGGDAGRPVAGARVALRVERPADPLGLPAPAAHAAVHAAATDAAGRATLPDVVQGDYLLQVEAAGFAAWSRALRVPGDLAAGPLRITLQSAARVEGRVLGGAGRESLRLCRVVAWRAPDATEAERRVVLARPGSDGGFRFDALSPGLWRFGACQEPVADFVASHLEADPGSVALRSLAPGAVEQVEVTLAAPRVATVHGRLVVEGLESSASLSVELSPPELGEGLSPRTQRARVAADGRFELARVPVARGHRLRVFAEPGRHPLGARVVDVASESTAVPEWRLALGSLLVWPGDATRLRLLIGAAGVEHDAAGWQRSGGLVRHELVRGQESVALAHVPAGSVVVVAVLGDGTQRRAVVEVAAGGAAMPVDLRR